MKPAAFDYLRAETLDEALAALADTGHEIKVLAGGQSLVPLLSMRLTRPQAVLDINRLADLSTLERKEEADTLTIGALVRQRQLEIFTENEPRARLLHEALLHIGHPQTRNRGTVGGSLVHADPSAELPLLLTVLDGAVVLKSVRGERTVGARDFFLSHYTTAIEADELLVASIWPLPTARAGTAFKEFRRRHGDFALMAAACILLLDQQRRIQSIQLALGGLAETPFIVDEARMLTGDPWSKEAGRALAATVVQQIRFVDDVQATEAYRRQLASVLIERIVEMAHNDAIAKEQTHV
jgi:2-furoyl-CoA dehydrogenase FAD binding subunit